jgi:hypothetical protein
MVTAHEPLHLDKHSFVEWKIVDIPTSFIWIIIFFNGPFEYGDDGIFKLLRCMQNLHHSMWDHKVLYADRSLEDGQLLIRPLLRQSKNMNMAGSWTFTFYFMERTHEPLHLDRLSYVHWKIMDITTSFIWIIIFFNRVFNNLKLWGYVGTNTELLCVEFCNFVQCHIFVSSLSCYCFMKGVLNIRGTNMVADKY